MATGDETRDSGPLLVAARRDGAPLPPRGCFGLLTWVWHRRIERKIEPTGRIGTTPRGELPRSGLDPPQHQIDAAAASLADSIVGTILR
jgi:hypothetical protein